MKKRKFIIVCLLGISVLSHSCKKNVEDDNFSVSDIKGHVQKGPFNNGTTINLFELTDNLVATGQTFNAQIEDNNGLFNLNTVQLVSSKVKLEATGYYFNEVLGENSDGPLTLYALSDISDKSDVNVNIITYLENKRVEKLLENGIGFSEAKIQAQQEIFQIFNIDNSQFQESELLDIMQLGDENAALLAVSAIIQGFRNTADLSLLLADMVSDFKTDGTIDNANIQTQLISHIKIANLDKIRTNLLEYYTDNELGSAEVPDFEFYVQQFIDNTEFEFIIPVTFPDICSSYLNFLSNNNTDFTSVETASNPQWYSICVDKPIGVSVRVEAQGMGYAIGYLENFDFIDGAYIGSSSSNYCYAMVHYTPPGYKTINVYFNDISVPFISREIYVN